MKNIKRNSFIILVISAIFVFYMLKDNFFETTRILRNANLLWLLLAVVLFAIHIIVEAIAMCILIREKQKDYPFYKMIKLLVMTKFFNGITPFASGGQPIQVYELKKEGIDASIGANIIVEHFIIFQAGVMFLTIISVAINRYFVLFKYDPVLTNLFIFGFIINALILIIVYISSISQKINIKFSKLINNLGYKLKIIKNKEANQQKLNIFLESYFKGFKELKENRKKVFGLITLQVLSSAFLFLIPQCVFNALNVPHNLNVLTSIIAGVYVFIAGSFVPIPGGTGGIEFAFLCFYSNFVSAELLPPALLAWRFITYYGPVVGGAIIYNLFPNKKIEE